MADAQLMISAPDVKWDEILTPKVQLIDPVTAAEILSRNRGNRKVDRSVVEIYAEAMKRGEWKLHHQGIAIDGRGELLDGQHRLEAVVKSGVTIPVLVVRGVDRDAFSVVDTGKRRSVSDSLRTIGATDVYIVGAALRYLHLYDNLPADIGWKGARARLTNDQVLKLYQGHPQMMDCVRQARAVAKAVPVIASACATAIYVTTRAAPGLDQSEWFNGIIKGVQLDEADPRLRFRNLFLNMRAQGGRRRMDAREHVALFIKAWNLWCRGERRQLLSFRKDESMPRPAVASR